MVSGFGTYFFQHAGLNDEDAFSMSVGQGGIHFVANCVAFWVTGRFGRRTLYLWGQGGMIVMLFINGFVALAPASIAQGYASSAVYLVW